MLVRRRRRMGWWLLGLVLPVLGCGTATVTGTVTYDGQPVTKGKITFLAPDENGAAVGTDIEQSKYTLKDLSPGKKQVIILVLASGEKPIVPPEVAKETRELTRGSQTLDFSLKRAGKAGSSKE